MAPFFSCSSNGTQSECDTTGVSVSKWLGTSPYLLTGTFSEFSVGISSKEALSCVWGGATGTFFFIFNCTLFISPYFTYDAHVTLLPVFHLSISLLHFPSSLSFCCPPFLLLSFISLPPHCSFWVGSAGSSCFFLLSFFAFFFCT